MDLRVEFTKAANGRACAWQATRGKRTRVTGPTMAAGPDLPHDLMTFVIEQALGLDSGFFATLAAGATFRSTDARRTDRGTAIIRERAGDLDEAEALVNAAYFAWRGDKPDLVDDALLTDRQPSVERALDAMLVRWRALEDGESLDLRW